MFPQNLLNSATHLLQSCRAAGLQIATAESCTGGLIAAVLTEIPGSSDVFERGYVTYSNAAKIEMLGVRALLIENHGAVSKQVAEAMALGALVNSAADLSLAVTGIAGPGGGSVEKPVGLVHIAAAVKGGGLVHSECRFGDPGRASIRLKTVQSALELGLKLIGPAAQV